MLPEQIHFSTHFLNSLLSLKPSSIYLALDATSLDDMSFAVPERFKYFDLSSAFVLFTYSFGNTGE